MYVEHTVGRMDGRSVGRLYLVVSKTVLIFSIDLLQRGHMDLSMINEMSSMTMEADQM